MTFECSECGTLVETERPPWHCDGCGLAGVIFLPAEDEETASEWDASMVWYDEGLRAKHLKAERPDRPRHG
jgi:hypothetical protein